MGTSIADNNLSEISGFFQISSNFPVTNIFGMFDKVTVTY